LFPGFRDTTQAHVLVLSRPLRPDEVSRGPGMQVPSHPYIGLQTAPPLPPVPLRPR